MTRARPIVERIKGMQVGTEMQIALGVTGGLVVLILVTRFLYVPIVGQIGERRTTLAGLRVKLADAQWLVQRRGEEEAALRNAREAYQALEAQFGGEQSVARALELLGSQSKSHGLKLVMVQPQTDAMRLVSLGPKLTLRELPLQLRVTGRYQDLGEFLGWLLRGPFLSSIRTLKVTKPSSGPRALQAELTLAVYLMEGTPS